MLIQTWERIPANMQFYVVCMGIHVFLVPFIDYKTAIPCCNESYQNVLFSF